MTSQITGGYIIALRARVLKHYDDAEADPVTRPGAFGAGAYMIQKELGCDFRVACMLMDCWISERKAQSP